MKTSTGNSTENSIQSLSETAAAGEKMHATNYWLGLDDTGAPFGADSSSAPFGADDAFAKRAEEEFMSSPLREGDGQDGFARREFLKLMGASIAMATTACVRRPSQKIIPYAQAPVEITPGEPNFYASTWFDGQEGAGILVKTLEGRPIKIEGNSLHPMNKGGLPARAHAEVLSLYDPDRLRAPLQNLPNPKRTNRETISAKFESLDPAVVEALGKGQVAILTGTLPSPSTRALIADFLKVYPGRHVQWDSLPLDAVREGARRSFGRAAVPSYRIDQAKMIVSIDADFLGTLLSTSDHMKQWSTVRTPGPGMARLVSFESVLSLTGMNADDRFRIRASQQLDVVLGLLYEVGVVLAKAPVATSGRVGSVLATYANTAVRLGLDPASFKKTAVQLWENRGKGLVIAGGLQTQTESAVDLQVAVNLLNTILGNVGETVDFDSATLTAEGSSSDLAGLIADMAAGKVSTLIIYGANPMYALPTEAGFQDAVVKVPMVVYAGNYNDETGRIANYVVPPGSSMEAWGDYELQSGVFSIQQPTIRPLFDTRSFAESLHAWASKAKGAPARLSGAASWYEYVRAYWKSEIIPKSSNYLKKTMSAGVGKSFDEDAWISILQGGVAIANSGGRGKPSFNADSFPAKAPKAREGYELVLYAKVGIGDGRYANIPWMQELPDPVSKIVWDNYLCVSPKTAEKEKLRQGDMVALKVGEKTLKVPVAIQPGTHDSVLGLAIGYGREHAGKVASGLGVNALALASWSFSAAATSAGWVTSGLPATFAKTGQRYDLVTTQGHHQLRDPKFEAKDRPIVAEATLAAFQKDPSSGIERQKVFSIWPEHEYSKHKWAMHIDLNTCTGCSACVIACQSENNVPTVGKKYVMQGREMHWIRIDRYYKGDMQDPEAIFQPMLCQHCENAPCETVCPVLATVHNDEGLNDMVYNRCVGTRYCSNNCPYKVRRFNWFSYEKRPEPTHMSLNPDVTVRSRGVMEKCTFCVQRIRKGTNAARDRGARVKDGDITPACAESCPSNAIVFGDLNDPESRVAKAFKNQRTFGVLEELNTVPRVRYATRIRNADRVLEEPVHAPKHDNKHKEGGHA